MAKRYLTKSIGGRFWPKVDVRGPSECWPWTACTKGGYGMIKYQKRSYFAPRVSWEIANGPIPDGTCFCHTCDNPTCVNPAHLWIGTHLDNMRDRDSKGRNYRGMQARGQSHGRSKLTDQDVLAIRARIGEPIKDIAADFGVARSLISKIHLRQNWKHI